MAQQIQRLTESRRGQVYNTWSIWNGLLKKKKKILGNENVVGFLIEYEYISFLGMLQIITNSGFKSGNLFISHSSIG